MVISLSAVDIAAAGPCARYQKVTELLLLDRIADVANGVNQRRITDLLSETADENFDQLRMVLMRVFPNAFAQFGAREYAAGLPPH